MTTAISDKDLPGGCPRPRSVPLALVSLALSMLLSSLGVSIANVALPTLADAFGSPFQGVQWVVLSYLLAITISIVGAGRLGDMMGHRRILVAGIALFTIASLLCGFAPALWVLIVARAIQGLGAAVLLALTVAFVRATVPNQRTGSAMGLLGTMSAIGTALGPSLGGILIAGPGWRAIFLVMVPLGVANVLLAQRYLPGPANKAAAIQTGFDGLGTLLLGVTLAAYALVVTVGGGGFQRANEVLIVIAIVCAGLFVFTEKRVASPLIRLEAFRDVTLTSSLVMNALVSTVMMATLVVGPFYLSGALGLGNASVGMVMSVGPVISALTGVPAGRVVDRLGAPSMIVSALAAMATGSAALATLPPMLGVPGYVLAMAVLTPGYQLFQAANNTAVMTDVPAERRGVFSGMLTLSRNLGLITGASVMGAVFAMASGASVIAGADPGAVTSGLQVTFAVATLLITAALAIAWGLALPKVRKGAPSDS